MVRKQSAGIQKGIDHEKEKSPGRISLNAVLITRVILLEMAATLTSTSSTFETLIILLRRLP
jgi:hypothetical protein